MKKNKKRGRKRKREVTWREGGLTEKDDVAHAVVTLFMLLELQGLLLSWSVLGLLTVGVDEERVVASVAAGKGGNRWKEWLLLLLESRW